MIKATELRIGNKVDINGTVLTITAQDYARSIAYPNHFEDYKGIPLTEEWLEKFGFNGWDKGNYTMVLSNYTFMEYEHFIADGIKYVHQLQNLYFALTGWELVDTTEDRVLEEEEKGKTDIIK